MTSPIGSLMVEASKKAGNKVNGHTSVATCGCEVTVSKFGSGSERIAPSPCAEHREKSEVAQPTKRRRRGVAVEV